MWSNRIGEGFKLSAFLRTDLDHESAYWDAFVTALNMGLQPFFATAVLRSPAEPPEEFDITEFGIDLYSAACQQIFNLMIEDCPPLHCENQTCNHDFVRQLGPGGVKQGAKHGQHRMKGVRRFCSPACARAETQRTYRRKRRAREEKEDKR